MAGTSLTLRALVAVGALALLAGCTDDGETTTAGSGLAMPSSTTEVSAATDPTTTEAETDEPTTTEATTTTSAVARPETADVACTTFATTLLLPVGAEPSEDDEGFVRALEALIADGTEPAAGASAAVLALDQADSAFESGESGVGDLTPEEASAILEEGYAGLGVLYEWALDTCPVEGVVWSCAVTTGASTFTQVGEAIDGPGAESTTTTTEPGAASPEEVYDEAESEGEPVEVSRTDDEVVVAWVDGDGHAVEVLTVVDDGGWRSDGVETCEEDGNPYDMAPASGG